MKKNRLEQSYEEGPVPFLGGQTPASETVQKKMNGVVCVNVECGKQACLTIYISDNCFWCDVAKEMVSEIMRELGMDKWVKMETIKPEKDVIVAFPTIDICNDHIVGKPDEWELRSKLLALGMKAAVKEVGCPQ